jgi:hypothetical protein
MKNMFNAFTAFAVCVFLTSDLAADEIKAFTDKTIVEKPEAYFDSNISEKQFFDVIDTVQKTYDEIIESNNLKPLKISGNWKSTIVNAYMKEQLQVNLVDISGALARRPEISIEGLALIVCHEVGHAYGGKPEKRAPLFLASVEGQADYYGVGVCLKKVISKIEETYLVEATSFMQDSCERASDSYNCLRLLKAGQSAANFLTSLKEEPLASYETPDSTKVRRTLKSYPDRVQCRLDTYYNAVFEKERPRCWYKR